MRRRMNQMPKTKPNYGKLFKSLKPYYFAIIVAFIFISGSVLISIYAPQILKDFTNEIANNAVSQSIDMDKIFQYGMTLIIMYIANALLSFGSSYIMNEVTQRYSKSLRSQISLKINRMKLKYFDSHPYGDTLSIVTNDVDNIAQNLQNGITMLFQSIFMLIGVLIAMFITSWQMSCTILISIPLMLIMLVIIMKKAIPLFRLRQDYTGKVNGIVEENYSGQSVIKLFNAEKTRGDNFLETNQELHKTMFKAQFYGGIMQPMMSFVSYFSYAAVFLVGGLLMAYNKGVSFGTITAFTMYVNLFQSPLSQIAQAMNSLQMCAASAARVFEFLDEEELDDESNKPLYFSKESVKGKVEFRNVKFGYNEDRIIIPNFSCKIDPGMKVAIVGPTGAGKTTIVNLLMRFYEINEGDILIDDVSIKDMSRTELRSLFGMVLQDTWMFEGTFKENILFNKENVSDELLQEVIKEANLSHFVSTLSEKENTLLKEDSSLSAGQKQLMTIARAMIENAPLLILDEATSNVDTKTEISIQEAMDKLTKGRTSFVIAHRLSTIKNADLILVMKDGNIIEHGNHDELMSLNGFYAGLYNSQFIEEQE
jgi:ATP-binding cassette, subfamily B, multidrug efflux pump